jgi:hypothetical protein
VSTQRLLIHRPGDRRTATTNTQLCAFGSASIASLKPAIRKMSVYRHAQNPACTRCGHLHRTPQRMCLCRACCGTSWQWTMLFFRGSFSLMVCSRLSKVRSSSLAVATTRGGGSFTSTPPLSHQRALQVDLYWPGKVGTRVRIYLTCRGLNSHCHTPSQHRMKDISAAAPHQHQLAAGEVDRLMDIHLALLAHASACTTPQCPSE